MTPIPQLRKTLRARRQQLTSNQQQLHSKQACQQLLASALLNQSKKIAVFISQDGELSTNRLIEHLWQTPNLEVYLPAVETRPNLHMGFSRYTPNTTMRLNSFGIPEPDFPIEHHLSGQQMDLVIMPLVGFDSHGNRLGMGGGFYDRTFAFKLEQPQLKPLLIGWAHSCQQVDTLEKQTWDVPLNALVTERGVLTWSIKS